MKQTMPTSTFFTKATCGFVICYLSFAICNAQQIPRSIGFAGMSVQLDEEARTIIQTDVKALMANKKYWEAKLDRCLMYFPIVEGVLIDEEVPTDFKFLAVQESSLQPDVVSASNAVGFWQFKKETATDYGLRVDEQIDERKNISASSRAAAKYLKKSNLQFNNWVASLYSYYLGAGGISKSIPTDWAYAREIKLTGKSDRYILRFFAHKIAIESAIERYQPANATLLLEYPRGGGRTMEGIAYELNVDVVALKTYNRWLTSNDIPADKEYILTVPVNGDQIGDVRAKITAVKPPNKRDAFAQTDIGFPVLKRAERASRDGMILYEINGLPGIMAINGDDAASIARKAKVSFGSFLRYNEMSEEDPITPAEVYYLEKKHKKAAVPYHTVREGESLWKVSQIYGVRIKKLLRFNRIDNRVQRLQTGRVLWLTERRPRKTPIEIVNQTEELFPGPSSKSQPQPALQERFDEAPAPTTTAKTPAKPAERKVYAPKMADTPAPTQPEEGVEFTAPKTATKPAETATKPNRRAPSFNPGDDNKIVVVSGDDAPAPKKKEPAQKPKETTTKPAETAPTPKPKEAEPAPVAKKPEPTSKPAQGSFYHTVAQGQTFFSVSKMYDVSIKDIKYWNNLADDANLKIDQKLLIKTVGETVSQQPQPQADEYITHTVELGETMFRVAQKYGVKVDQIKEWNNLTETGVQAGQKLKVKKP
jgi:membrane-bound lytic murein transglycosylase D